jgi:hypothetical protein
MRITEIESQIETEKKGALVTLLNMLKTKADRRDTGSKISVDSLSKLMSNLGYNIGYAELDSLVKSSDTIRNLIGDYNQEFVTLATTDTIDQDNNQDQPGNQDTVKQMAKRAAKRRN